MNKLTIFIICIIAILAVIGYNYYNYKVKKSNIDTNNMIYKNSYEKELKGNELATIINKALDSNEKNNIKKDKNGLFIENDENSIKIEIKFKQSDYIFAMETIYQNKVAEFIRLYGQATFKCTKLNYHKKTKLVKYLYFQEL